MIVSAKPTERTLTRPDGVQVTLWEVRTIEDVKGYVSCYARNRANAKARDVTFTVDLKCWDDSYWLRKALSEALTRVVLG